MKKNFFLKFVISVIFILVLINIFPASAKATISDIIDAGDSFLKNASTDENGYNALIVQQVSSDAYNILLTIGIIIAVIVGIILGIKWMIVSLEDKAKIKEMLIPYIVGCLILFGAFAIWQMVVNFGQKTQQAVGSTSHTSSSGGTHGGGEEGSF